MSKKQQDTETLQFPGISLRTKQPEPESKPAEKTQKEYTSKIIIFYEDIQGKIKAEPYDCESTAIARFTNLREKPEMNQSKLEYFTYNKKKKEYECLFSGEDFYQLDDFFGLRD